MDTRIMFVHTLSPLHAGTGQGIGVIDLPIAREKATAIPFLPGSSLKGVFRDACSEKDLCTRIFGPDTMNAETHAGAVHFTDARLLLLPVRSLRGVFAWITSPFLLRRLLRDAKDIKNVSINAQAVSPADDETCLVSGGGSALVLTNNGSQQVIIEDLPLNAISSPEVSAWAMWLGTALFPQDDDWQQLLNERLCVVTDDVLSFLLETATEVTARIRIQENQKTVERGALWYEEALPTETVLTGLVVAASDQAGVDEVFQTIKSLTGKVLQFGGNATIGRGLCKTSLMEEIGS